MHTGYSVTSHILTKARFLFKIRAVELDTAICYSHIANLHSPTENNGSTIKHAETPQHELR
jgi:hypothetical protein